VIGVPGPHESYGRTGVVYKYIRVCEIAEVTIDTYERLAELGDASRGATRRTFAAGEPIPDGARRDTVFTVALQRLRDGAGRAEILSALLARTYEPPPSRRQIEEHVDGVFKWAANNPSESEKARARARAVLNGDEQPVPSSPWKAKPCRVLHRRSLSSIPAERVQRLAGLPVGVLSTCAGVGRLGKSARELARAKQVLRGPLAQIVSMAGYEPAGAEEMPQQEEQPYPTTSPVAPMQATKEQTAEIRRLLARLAELRPDLDWKQRAQELAGVPSAHLTQTIANRLITQLQQNVDAAEEFDATGPKERAE
jgi:hypothetical protein